MLKLPPSSSQLPTLKQLIRSLSSRELRRFLKIRSSQKVNKVDWMISPKGSARNFLASNSCSIWPVIFRLNAKHFDSHCGWNIGKRKQYIYSKFMKDIFKILHEIDWLPRKLGLSISTFLVHFFSDKYFTFSDFSNGFSHFTM